MEIIEEIYFHSNSIKGYKQLLSSKRVISIMYIDKQVNIYFNKRKSSEAYLYLDETVSVVEKPTGSTKR